MLQLHLDFDIGVLEALVTPKVVEEVIIKVEEKVVTACRVALEVVGTNRRSVTEAEVLAEAPDVVEIDDVDES